MDTLPKPILDGLAFEHSNFVSGSCHDDPFYDCPDQAENAAPGTLLKLERTVDTSEYLMPPATALSRFIYQSENLNGQLVPVSALIMWPYTASPLSDGLPVVAWAHGTSGVSPDCAPSHHKNLWQHFLAPYQLVLQGYVVVATDYAGLGVSKTYSGTPITHEYLSFPSHANDVFHGVNAAQQAFGELSKSFVVIGHSQGGGAAWGCAQRQSQKPVEGYLGAVAVSPATKILDEPGEFAPLLGVGICPAVAATDSAFDLATVLSQSGLQYLDTVLKLSAGLATATALYMGMIQTGADLLKPNWKENEHIQRFQSRVANGGKAIGGPLLVIHGESDPRLSVTVASKAVTETARLHPSSQLTYATLPEVEHTPALLASQKLWLDWISNRFHGEESKFGCQHIKIIPLRPTSNYHKAQNWYLEAATEYYHAP